jgi:ubiquinone/menaquinone biosynthesis C-methylase UbiE
MPDESPEAFREIHRILKPGGQYITLSRSFNFYPLETQMGIGYHFDHVRSAPLIHNGQPVRGYGIETLLKR